MADAVGDIERGLMLEYEARGFIPFTRVSTGQWTLAENSDHRFWLLDAGNTGPHSEIIRKLVVDLGDLRLHRRAISEELDG